MSEDQFTRVLLAVDELSGTNLEVKGVIIELLALNALLTLQLSQVRRELTEVQTQSKYET